MENNQLFELADELKALRDRKDALEAELKQVNMDIDKSSRPPRSVQRARQKANKAKGRSGMA